MGAELWGQGMTAIIVLVLPAVAVAFYAGYLVGEYHGLLRGMHSAAGRVIRLR